MNERLSTSFRHVSRRSSTRRRQWRAAAIALLAAASLPLQGAEPAELPCSGEEYRQLDFWVGEWDLEFDTPEAGVGRAENRITKDQYGQCVISEHFRLPGDAEDGSADFIGTSLSTYDRLTRSWRQVWVDNSGNFFDLRGGPVAGQGHVFEFVTIEPRGPDAALRRMIWEDVTEGSLVWRWQKQLPDRSWEDLWVIRYRRSQD